MCTRNKLREKIEYLKVIKMCSREDVHKSTSF
jgi:hypothetical protein